MTKAQLISALREENGLSRNYLCNDQLRIVEIAGRKFCEGMLEATLNEINDDAFEERGNELWNKTKTRTLH
jgi:hypothetical protein